MTENDDFLSSLQKLRTGSRWSIPAAILGLTIIAIGFGLFAINLEQQRTAAREQSQKFERKWSEAEERVRALNRELAEIKRSVEHTGGSEAASNSEIVQAITSAQSQVAALENLSVSGAVDTPVRPATVIARGLPSGWDVDVFYCTGSNDASMKARALQIVNALGSAAKSEQALAPGVKLGRIQLRELTPEMRKNGKWFDTRDAVVRDGQSGEDETARALQAYLMKTQQISLELVVSNGRPTKWYVSIDVCHA